MKEIMKIEDSFSTKETGLIVSGVNPQLDTMDKERIKSQIGDKVRIISPGGKELFASVRDVAISESLVGKRNISIALGGLDGLSMVDQGSSLYAVE